MKILYLFFYLTLTVHIFPRTLDQIIKSGELRIGYYPSITIDKPGYEKGFDYELAEAIAYELGLKPKFYELKYWNEFQEDNQGNINKGEFYTPVLFYNNTCDILALNLTVTKEREKIMDFIEIYLSRNMIVVHKDNYSAIEKISDLAGKKTTLISGTTYYDWLMKQNKTILSDNPVKITTKNYDYPILKELNQKIIDFTILDSPVALSTIEHNYQDLRYAIFVGSIDKIGWGFKKDTESLQDEVRKIICKYKDTKDSPLNVLFKKYFGITYYEFENLFFYTISTSN